MDRWLNKILLGDCLDIMREMPDKCVDLVLTDPPYRNEKENQPTKDMRINGGMNNFGEKLTVEQFKEIQRISKHQIIFGFNNFDFLPSCKGFIVWHKTNIPEKFTMSMAEIAYVSESLSTISKLIPMPSNNEARIHPTQKPVALFEWILRLYSKPGDIILDPFLGSGTTVAACINLERQYIGIEINPDYVLASQQRIKKATEQRRLFL